MIEVLRLVPGQRAQAARQDDGLAVQRPRALGRPFFDHHDARAAEAVDRLAVVGLGEVARDRLRDLRADAGDLVDVGLAGGQQRAPCCRSARRGAGPRARPTMRMPSAVEQAREPARLRALDRGEQVARRLLGEPVELGQRLGGEPVEVGEVLHHAAVHELADHDLAEVLDVHGPPRAEVKQPLLELGRAGGVGAAPDGLALRARKASAPQTGHTAGIRNGSASGGRCASTTWTR